MDTFDLFLLKIVIGFILFGIIFNIIFVIHTEFEKEITIKEKYITTNKNSVHYHIISSDDNIYNVVDLWWKGEFNSGDDYAQLNVGKTYRVKGYGLRVPFLSMNYKIYSVEL